MKRFFYTNAAVLLFAGAALANEFEAELKTLASERIADVASSAQVIAAVKAQNGETGSYDQAKIDELDKIWRAEAEAVDQPMLCSVSRLIGFAFRCLKSEISTQKTKRVETI